MASRCTSTNAMLIGLAVAMSFVSTFSSVDRAAAAAPVTY